MSPGIEAISKLSRLGFAFEVNGDRVRYRYQGPDTPDPAQVRPLLKVVKAYKADVLAHLSKPATLERILSCADCGFHEYQGPNPRQGWGRCKLKNRGCYGLRPACSEIPPRDGNVPRDG
jgi:hypothetical protein